MRRFPFMVCILLVASCSLSYFGDDGKRLYEEGLLVSEYIPGVLSSCSPPEEASTYELYVWVNTYIRETNENDNVDIWQNPQKTLMMRSGDCEDFVILFLHLVYINTGVQGEMAVFYLPSRGYGHAVALVEGVYYDLNSIIPYRCRSVIDKTLSYEEVMNSVSP